MNDNLARTISKNAAFTASYNLWYLGSRLVITPIILAHVSVDEYGLWSFCFVILSYLALSAFGFNNTYIRFTAEHLARGEYRKVNELLSTGLISMSILAALMLVVFLTLLTSIIKLLGIDPALQQTARLLLGTTAIIFVLNFTLAGYQSLLEGQQKIALVKTIHLTASILELGLLILFFKAGLGIFSLLWAYCLRFLFIIAGTIWFAKKEMPFLRVDMRDWNREAFKKFTGFGNQMTLIGILTLLINSLDRILITRMINLQAVGLYEIGRKLPNIGLMLPSSIAGTFMPAASHLKGSDQMPRLREIYITASRYLMILSALPYIFLIFFAEKIITVWVGSEFAISATVMRLLALGTFINIFTGIGTACARGIGRADLEIQYTLITLFLIILLLPFMLNAAGIRGAAMAYCTGQICGSFYFMTMINRLLNISWQQFCARVVAPVIVAVLTVLPASAGCHHFWPDSSRWWGLTHLVTWGLVYCFLTAATVLLFRAQIVSAEEKTHLSRLIPHNSWRSLWT